MSKFLLLNKDNVIIDIVDQVKYVNVNKNGLTVLCRQHEAQGYLGSDGNTIYAKVGTQFKPSYDDIAREGAVEELPDGVVPYLYKYDFDLAKIVPNDKPYAVDNTTLTQATSQNTANLEYLAMMTGIEIL